MTFGKVKSPPPPTPAPSPPTPPSQADTSISGDLPAPASMTSLVNNTSGGLARKARTGKRSLIGGA
jgi:hypothetical protein